MNYFTRRVIIIFVKVTKIFHIQLRICRESCVFVVRLHRVVPSDSDQELMIDYVRLIGFKKSIFQFHHIIFSIICNRFFFFEESSKEISN